ncbi:c2h2 finger domain containing protein [Grosmannia clavigera kw1407]|uniref:C2h2 finger domain containing protein n=1 Tax=Grosmannia clavigera (strain kw1407 / UAMH 11150) TaxID=655863 RepID=F0XLT2_GROCL|nr:c2h2 finger domain containing protein [Grosmannia clavigera kw1407]EFX01107.1 c2h2 finger domain containing protein [Grosmannia clavigera kw1407]
MGKAEVGSVKHLNNQMKARGLTRLRWYCQVCERALRDENSFKQHTLSESHVRNMLAVGSNPRKVINEYSDQFLKDFLQLLRTGHGEKQVQINHFYQEYIAKRDHIHMNSTRWSSLTELAKHLGQESICRVEENEKGIFISWIDTSPEALRRQEALRRKEAQDRGDEEWERRMLKAQIERAERAAKERRGDEQASEDEDEEDDKNNLLERQEGEKVKLSFGSAKPESTAAKEAKAPPVSDEQQPASGVKAEDEAGVDKKTEPAGLAAPAAVPTAAKPVSLKLGGLSKPQPKNVFAAAKKNALSGGGGKKIELPKKMSEAERIMKEELERKRSRDFSSHGAGRSSGPNKKPRV